MKKNILEYAAMLLSVLVLGLTIFWFYHFATSQEHRRAEVKRNLYETVLHSGTMKTEIIRNEEEFALVKEQEVYFDYYRGRNTEKYMQEGKIEVIDDSGNVLLAVDLTEKYYKNNLKLAGGNYKIVETLKLHPNPETELSFEQYSDLEKDIRKADAYSFVVNW